MEDVRQEVKKISPEGSDVLMSIAQKLFNEGEAKGREEGSINAKIETAKRQLTKKFGELPEDLVKKLQKANIQELDAILDNILDIQSIEEVYQLLNI